MTTTERLTTTTLAGSVLRLGLGVGLRDEDLLVLDITSNVGAGVQVEVVRLLRHTTTGAALTGGTTEVVRMVNLVHTRALHEVVDTAVLINRVDAEEVVHHLLEVLDSAVGLVVHAVGLVVPVVQLLHTVKVQTLALRVLQEVLVELVRVTGSTTTTGAAATGLKVGVVGTILIGLDPVRLGVVGSVGGTISGLDRLSRRSLRDEHLLLLTLVVAPELLGVTTACLAVSSGHSVSLRSVDGGVVAVCVFDVEVDLLERSGLTGSGLSPAITADTAHVEILSLLLIPSVAKGLSFLYNRIIFVQVRFLELSRRVNEVPRYVFFLVTKRIHLRRKRSLPVASFSIGREDIGHHRRLVSRVEHKGELEEGDVPALFVDEDILPGAVVVDTAQNLTLLAQHMGAHGEHVGGLVAAVGALADTSLSAHRDGVESTRDEFVGELGELFGVDLLDDLDELVVTVLHEAGGDNNTAGLAGVVVDMVDEDWLTQEGPVGLLELLGRPPVEVLVDTGGDGPDLGVNLAGGRLPVREDVKLMEVEVSESLLGEDRGLLGTEPLGSHPSAHSGFLSLLCAPIVSGLVLFPS